MAQQPEPGMSTPAAPRYMYLRRGQEWRIYSSQTRVRDQCDRPPPEITIVPPPTRHQVSAGKLHRFGVSLRRKMGRTGSELGKLPLRFDLEGYGARNAYGGGYRYRDGAESSGRVSRPMLSSLPCSRFGDGTPGRPISSIVSRCNRMRMRNHYVR